MKTPLKLAVVVVCLVLLEGPAALQAVAEPAVTVYNQDFAVVRETVPLELKGGVNQIEFTDITAHVEPDSVMLRDPSGKRMVQILEQNYRADPVSQELLLSLCEGQTIEFIEQTGQTSRVLQGKIVRSGYAPHGSAMGRYGQQYAMQQSARAYGPSGQPIIEVDGKLRFGLPGIPLFPKLADDTVLKPTLQWAIQTDKAGPLEAELCYVTGGMSWEASYNLVAPEKGDKLDIVGWVTMDNQSGKTFENSRIKLMAGDVSKIREQAGAGGRYMMLDMSGPAAAPPQVTQKAFDEYHLYTLERPTTLHDRETKQVEFVRATGVKSDRFYVYDGAKIDPQRYQGWNMETIRQDQGYGTESNPKVWSMCEFKNSESNGLGMPLPKGRTRFYRRDTASASPQREGQLEFTGENLIDHTPQDETVRVYTGSAFDLVGERKRTAFNIDQNQRWVDEAFEIKLRNHKKEAVEVRVVEHLYRWSNWEIKESSNTFNKLDSQLIEFRVSVKPDQEAVVTYKVHYTW